MNVDDREFTLVMGSDLERDGMFLELYEGAPSGNVLAECFYSDVDGSLSVTRYDASIPDAALEWLRDEGARRLRPMCAPPNDR